MTPMVQGAFAFSTEALTQRWSWGRVMSRRSGGTWQPRWPRARKLGPAETHKSLRRIINEVRGISWVSHDITVVEVGKKAMGIVDRPQSEEAPSSDETE